MVRAGREQLKGPVEVDETYIAITDRDECKPRVRTEGSTTKTFVALAVEILEPKGFGRIRLQRVARDSEEYLLLSFNRSCSAVPRFTRMVLLRIVRSPQRATVIYAQS